MQPRLNARTRWRALDVFRGFVVLAMVIVNAADLGGHAYPALRHSRWDGCTFADSVFPGFLFIMGVAMGLSLRARRQAATLPRVYLRVLRRAALLIGLGVSLNALYAHGWYDLRWMGVLQRLGLCYLLGSLILLHAPARVQLGLGAAILAAHSWLVLRVPVPDAGAVASSVANNWSGYIDRLVLGRAHILSARPYLSRIDPEGVLGTATALVSVLMGAWAGRWLERAPRTSRSSLKLAGAGALSAALGVALGRLEPINKALWTTPFVWLTTGSCLLALALCFELVDVRECAAPLRWLECMGLNAIALYLLSSVLDALVLRLRLSTASGPRSAYAAALALTRLPLPQASLAFALAQAGLLWLLARELQARGVIIKL